jgi:hypothetical protein
MTTLIACDSTEHLAQFKSSLEIEAVDVLEDAEKTVLVEHAVARNLFLLNTHNRRLVGRAIGVLPNIQLRYIVYIMAQQLEFRNIADLPPNGREVYNAAQLVTYIPTLTEAEQAKLTSRLFIRHRTMHITPFELMRIIFQTSVNNAAHVPPPTRERPLPESWDKRLRQELAEAPVATSVEDNRCIICQEDRSKSVLFIPCDHLVCCEVCAKVLMQDKGICPICRCTVEDVRRVKKC